MPDVDAMNVRDLFDNMLDDELALAQEELAAEFKIGGQMAYERRYILALLDLKEARQQVKWVRAPSKPIAKPRTGAKKPRAKKKAEEPSR